MTPVPASLRDIPVGPDPGLPVSHHASPSPLPARRGTCQFPFQTLRILLSVIFYSFMILFLDDTYSSSDDMRSSGTEQGTKLVVISLKLTAEQILVAKVKTSISGRDSCSRAAGVALLPLAPYHMRGTYSQHGNTTARLRDNAVPRQGRMKTKTAARLMQAPQLSS
ncbi:hypothetical protein GGR52DRAFT_454216 [Hypoxylon sp. FL1284]|nr:hypothetical protein GGR52DRAFT_454216 [Hypoxylon sp. FL1284]